MIRGPVSAVIFDFDGVLADTEDLHCAAFQLVARERGLTLSRDDYYHRFLGLPDHDCLAALCAAAGHAVPAAELDRLVARKRRHFAQQAANTGLYPGVAPVLRALHEHFALAIASGAAGDEIEAVLERAGVRSLFGAIIAAEDVTAGKPAPDPFLRALGALNRQRPRPLAAPECVVVEDSPLGIAAARAAGMQCIAVTTSHDPAGVATADAIIDGVAHLRAEDLTPVTMRADPLSTLTEVAVALCSTLRLRELLAAMMERVRDVMDAEACSVMLVDDASRTLRWEVALGEGAGKLETLSVALGDGISGGVAASGEAIRIADAYTDPRWDGRRYDEASGFRTRSILCVPLRTHDRIVGVVQVLNRRGGPFTDDDQRLLEALAGMGGVAVENARLYESLEQKVEERTAALSRTLRDPRDTQTQLVQSEKMAALGSLVAGVAHEINTPLGAVTSNTDLLGRALTRVREAEGDPVQTHRYVELAAAAIDVSREACRRIAGIVSSLRNFSRLDEAERKPADLHEGLESTLTLAAHLTKNRITVHREYGSLPAVDCHANQINQVFLNVLANAAQAIEGPGTITIRTRCEEQERREVVVVEISDSGRGIPAEHLARVFDPGFTTKGVGVGTGLGLAICYRIVMDHRGTIDVESAVGRGTTFRIVLPVREAR